MSEPENLLCISCCAPERVSVYIVKGVRDEVISKAQSLYHWTTVTTLKAAPTQTPNPWNGTLLQEIAFAHPTDAFLEAIRYASLHLRDVAEHQRLPLTQKAAEILNAACRGELPLTADPRGDV